MKKQQPLKLDEWEKTVLKNLKTTGFCWHCGRVCKGLFCNEKHKRAYLREKRPKKYRVVVFALLILLWGFRCAYAEQIGYASWYSVESCRREGTSGIMANGEVLDDTVYTCASWDYSFGTQLKVVNLLNNKSVVVEVADRGPNRKLYKRGRIIDLTPRAFSEIADLKQGLVKVSVQKVNKKNN